MIILEKVVEIDAFLKKTLQPAFWCCFCVRLFNAVS